MTWTTVESGHEGLRAERYEADVEKYGNHNRTCYYDARSGSYLGAIYDHKEDKQQELADILEALERKQIMYARFDSFDNVAKMYAETVPLRGKRKAEDVRPIWQRRYWWRRVVKMNDNKYVLHDGDYTWQRTFEESCDLAPITWERKADGDYITIRNCHGSSYSVSRYSFLSNALPHGLSFLMSNGKHYIVDRQSREEHYLPKFAGKYDHNIGKWVLIEDKALTFKHLGGDKFERVSELMPMKVRRIDKDLKAKYDPLIKDAWGWACAVLPILGETMHDWTVRSDHANKISAGGVWNWERDCSSLVAREILENPEHEARLSLVALAAWSGGAFDNGSVDVPNKVFTPSVEAFRGFKKSLRKVVDVLATELR